MSMENDERTPPITGDMLRYQAIDRLYMELWRLVEETKRLKHVEKSSHQGDVVAMKG